MLGTISASLYLIGSSILLTYSLMTGATLMAIASLFFVIGTVIGLVDIARG